jgi:hypothetical protein
LDIVGEVVVDPASVPEVGNLDADNVAGLHVVCLALLAGRRERRRALVQRDARDFPRQDIGRPFSRLLVFLGII